mmetsp:Transcript_48013/g.102856  ORF Transcript_48013/g.102856 Transcript_48013/m.102856 type:complete len:230 (+) Transcript_48013:1006-1695(+)
MTAQEVANSIFGSITEAERQPTARRGHQDWTERCQTWIDKLSLAPRHLCANSFSKDQHSPVVVRDFPHENCNPILPPSSDRDFGRLDWCFRGRDCVGSWFHTRDCSHSSRAISCAGDISASKAIAYEAGVALATCTCCVHDAARIDATSKVGAAGGSCVGTEHGLGCVDIVHHLCGSHLCLGKVLVTLCKGRRQKALVAAPFSDLTECTAQPLFLLLVAFCDGREPLAG